MIQNKEAMETNFNFKTAICTSREQSERLLALGLKKETADMYYSYDIICAKPYYKVMEFMNGCVPEDIFPAWSLHRLIEMIQEVCPQIIIIYHRVDIRSNVKRIAYSFDVCDNLYDNICDCIEWLIKEGYFNKDHLEE